MRAKRTHRSGKAAIIEALESRRLLSGPAVVINYFNTNVDLDASPPQVPYEAQPSNGDTIDWITDVPLHVTGVTGLQDNLSSIPSDSQILFKNGDEFDVYSQLKVSQQNLFIGSWDETSSSLPIFVNYGTAPDGGNAIFYLNSSTNIVIKGLQFENAEPSAGVGAIEPGGANTAILNCTFTDVTNMTCIDTNLNGDGLYLQYNYINDTSDALDYFVFDSSVPDTVVIGNSITADTAGVDGIMRTYVDRLLIADNNLTNTTTKVVRLVTGSYNEVEGNTLNDEALTGPKGNNDGDAMWIGGDQVEESAVVPSDVIYNVIVERNTVTGNIALPPGADSVMLRNNLVSDNGYENSLFEISGEAEITNDMNQTFTLTDSDVYILNNTGMIDLDSVHTSFLQMDNVASNVSVINNLFEVSGSDSAAPIYLTDYGNGDILSSFSEFGGNVWADPNSSDAVYIQENGTYANPWSYEVLTDSSASIDYYLTTDSSNPNYVSADTYNLTLDVPQVPGILYPCDNLVSSVTFSISGNDAYSTTIDLSGGQYSLANVPLSPGDTITVSASGSTGLFPTFRIDGVSTDNDSSGNPKYKLPTIYEGSWSGGADWNTVYGNEDETWWNTKLEDLFGTSDTFANLSLNSSDIPTSDTGTASPVDGVFTDFYGKPRPANDWTVGAVEPDLDIASLGNVYLQTGDETVDGTAVPYVQVWNSQAAVSTSNSPWLSLPQADFEGVNITGLSGGSDNITLDLSTDDMITGDLFYLAQGGDSNLAISPNVTTNLSVEVGDAATLDISSLSNGSTTAPVMLVLSSLTICAGADAQLACGQFSILSLDSLNVVTSGSYGTLDLTNETMVLNPSSSDDSTIQEALAAAYDTGKWDESGITSSLAESYPREGMGLGYIFSDVSVGTGVSETSAWEAAYGITLGSYGIVVRFTFYGDTNLDGVVDGTDTTNYSTSGPTDWFHGNFNYDSYHDADDFSLLELGAAEQDAGNITGGPAFDAEDVTAFADALAAGSESAFNSEYSGLGWNYANADINGDGVVNSEDISGFDQIAADNGLAGFLNPTFGDDGMVTISGTYASFFAETTDANGNILATGTEDNHLIVARFFANGTLDTSFGTDGFTTIDVSTWDLGYAILALPNGNILVGGRGQVSGDVNSLLAMLNPDGSVDTSFGDDGSEIVDISAGYNVILGLALQPDGKFLACTYAYDGTYADVGLTRFNSDGTLDTSFGTDGTTLTSFDWWDGGSDVAVLSDGSILVSGNADGNMAVIKYNSDGTFDDSFGTDGVASFGVTGEARDMLVLSSGKILIAGQTDNNFVIGLLNSDGSVDTSFGTGGMVETDLGTTSCICGLIVQSNGQIVVSGYAGDDIVIARYNSDGSLDTSFGSGGMTQTDVGYALSNGMQQMLMQQDNGNYVVAAGTNGEMILTEYNG